MQEPKIVRLTSKELLICKINSEKEDGEVVMEDPFEIKSFMNPATGDFNSTLIDWLQFSDENFAVIDTFNIITVNSPDPNILSYYNELLERRNNVVESKVEKLSKPTAKKEVETIEDLSPEDYAMLLSSNKVIH